MNSMLAWGVAILAVIALFAAGVYVEMVIWNEVLVDAIDGVNPVTFEGMFCLHVLSMFLFKSPTYKSK